MASRIVQHLAEEYSNKTTFSYPVLPTVAEYNTGRVERLINMGLLSTHLFENSSMIIPVSLDPNWASTRFRKFNHVEYQVFA